MKLTIAIEILNLHELPMETEADHDFFHAIKLGIEALERLQECRQQHRPLSLLLLNSEEKSK